MPQSIWLPSTIWTEIPTTQRVIPHVILQQQRRLTVSVSCRTNCRLVCTPHAEWRGPQQRPCTLRSQWSQPISLYERIAFLTPTSSAYTSFCNSHCRSIGSLGSLLPARGEELDINKISVEKSLPHQTAVFCHRTRLVIAFDSQSRGRGFSSPTALRLWPRASHTANVHLC